MFRQRPTLYYLPYLLCLILLTTCRPQADESQDSQLDTQAPEPVAEATVPSSEFNVDVLPSSSPTPEIIDRSSTGLTSAPNDWRIADWLTNAWRDKHDPAEVRSRLQEAGWQNGFEDWFAADFDGDLRDEWAVVLHVPKIEPHANAFGFDGNLWVIGDSILYRYYATMGDDPSRFPAPKIVSTADYSGDGLIDLVINDQRCGEFTCFDNYQVISGGNGRLRNIVVSPPDDYFTSRSNIITMRDAKIDIVDEDNNGLPELLIQGGEDTSVGAGKVRTSSEKWAWNGEAIGLTETRLDPTPYRHHTLYEANDELEKGNIATAILLYEATINENLQPASDNAELETAVIKQFAAFRLTLIDLMVNKPSRASSRLAWLQDTYPQSAAARAASILVFNWTGFDGMDTLCNDIESGLVGFSNALGPLEADMGYANPSLRITDFCP